MQRIVKTFETFNFNELDLGAHEPHMNIDHDDHHEAENYMFFGNLETLHRLTGVLLEMDPRKVDALLKNGHNWAVDHVATSKDDIEEVANFLINEFEEEPAHAGEIEEGYMCEDCGCAYEGQELNDDMSCNECGGQVVIMEKGW